MTIILFAIPLFFLLIALELYIDSKRGSKHYRANDAITSLSAGVLSRVMAVGQQAIPFTIYALVFDSVAMLTLPDTLWVWVLAFVLYDFFYYWNHRFGHEVSILWAAHVVHHSSEDYNLTTALRQTSGALFSWVFYLPMALMGFTPEMVLTVGALNLVYQFWVHTQHIQTLGWMEKCFVTPSNHRVHHAQNRIYIDKNYGGVFIIWDRLFGTFMAERLDEPVIYGIRGALNSFNPVFANLQLYGMLARDSFYTKRWRDKWRVWFGRTGWRPYDVSQRFPVHKPPLTDFAKFNPVLAKAVTQYSVLQHGILLAVALYLLLNVAHLAGTHQLILAVTIVVMAVQNGLILSQSKVALALEGPRLLVLPLLWAGYGLSLPALYYGLASIVSLVWLVSAVRHSTKGLNGNLEAVITEPENPA